MPAQMLHKQRRTLIADEVMTGFRISQTGAVGHYNLMQTIAR